VGEIIWETKKEALVQEWWKWLKVNVSGAGI